MARSIKLGDIAKASFPVLDFDGITKLSGKTEFTTQLFLNSEEVATPPAVVVEEIGATGEYSVSFAPSGAGFWKLEVVVGYNNDLYTEGFEVGNGSVSDTYDIVRRIAGLVHENVYIDETDYDDKGQLISARMRVFDSKTNCDLATDGGAESTGLLGTYTLTTTWDSLNKYNVFKQTKVD